MTRTESYLRVLRAHAVFTKRSQYLECQSLLSFGIPNALAISLCAAFHSGENCLQYPLKNTFSIVRPWVLMRLHKLSVVKKFRCLGTSSQYQSSPN